MVLTAGVLTLGGELSNTPLLHTPPLRSGVCPAPLIDSSPPLSKGEAMKAKTSPRPESGAYAPPCSHCATALVVAALSDFVGLNRRHPLPGMAPVLECLGRWCGPDDLISICPACMCITTV